MTVAELIKKLETLNPERDVMIEVHQEAFDQIENSSRTTKTKNHLSMVNHASTCFK